jgi:hypothetical protein
VNAEEREAARRLVEEAARSADAVLVCSRADGVPLPLRIDHDGRRRDLDGACALCGADVLVVRTALAAASVRGPSVKFVCSECAKHGGWKPRRKNRAMRRAGRARAN